MNMRMPRAKFFITVGVLAVIVVAAFVLNNKNASVISPMSSFEQARDLSNGKKGACLVDNDLAINAVKADDIYLDEAKEFSNFEMTASSGILDVPAGTNYETTINDYANGLATGAITYEKDYGKYNYSIKKLPNAGEWEFVSMVACE